MNIMKLSGLPIPKSVFQLKPLKIAIRLSDKLITTH